MKEQGLIPDTHGGKFRELFVTNFAEPEVILDEKSRIKHNDTELGFKKLEYEADENEDVNDLILSDVVTEKTLKPMLVWNELHEWSPNDYIDKSMPNDASQVIVVEENSLETILDDEVFCGFEKFEEFDAIGNQLSNETTNYVSSYISRRSESEISNEVSNTYDNSNYCESDVARDPYYESHDESCDQASSEHLGFIGNQSDQMVESIENCVGHVTTRNEDDGDGKNSEIYLVSERNEKATKIEENISEIVFDNVQQVNEEFVGECRNIDDKNYDGNTDEYIDNNNEGEKVSVFCQKEIVENSVLENENELAPKENVKVKDLTAKEGDVESEVSLHRGGNAEEVEIRTDRNEGGNVFLLKSDAVEDVEIKNKPSDGIEDNKIFKCENQLDEKVEGLDVNEEVNKDRNGINDKKCPNKEARNFHRHERMRFDSCPDLGVYNDHTFDDVFSSGRSFKRASTTKEKKSKSSYTKLKKQTQRKKPASDSSQLAISKRLSFSLNSELGRLKKEYDASLAAFRRQRSKSLGLY